MKDSNLSREASELQRIYTALSEAKRSIGMTQTLSPAATIEALAKQILILRGDVLRLQARAKDPSGRWA
jgi:hypothetical protein